MAEKRTRTIARAFTFYSGGAVVAVMVLSIGLLAGIRIAGYGQQRARLQNALEDPAWRAGPAAGVSGGEQEAIRLERLAALNRQILRESAVAFAVLLVGLSIPLLISRHVARRVGADLRLLNRHLTGSGKEQSALMPRAFDFAEFGQILETMQATLRERNAAEQRWKQAEKELVAANGDLTSQAAELQRGKKAALHSMADAERAHREAKEANARLNLAIEEARQSARDADMASRAKSDFLATMSHEIRTPLNGVIGFVDMLSETELSGEQKEYVNLVKDSSQTLMALINDILDFSKIESGKLNLELRDFNLVRCLREVVAMFFGSAVKKGIQLNLEIDAHVPRAIQGDETRLRQIITNLLANAVKFTETGEIRLIVSCDSPINAEGFCDVEFEVRDTGIGMSGDQLQRLFNPFSQGDSSTTRKYGGTGLGLAICKRLAEAMGGGISATSEPGRGSSFYTTVRVRVIGDSDGASASTVPDTAATGGPAALDRSGGPDKPQEAGEAASQGDGARPREPRAGDVLPLRIAVAEDNKANQRVLMMMLRRLGWTAEFTENGAELIEYLSDHPCDLVLMDLQMPVLDGLEATHRIRSGAAGENLRNVRIVALTANALAGDEARCLRAGMDAYLSKPIKVALLEKKIRSLFTDSQPPEGAPGTLGSD